MKSIEKLLVAWSMLLLATVAGAQVIISEFMASNKASLADEDGDYSDWIELCNLGDNDVSITSWYLTDNAGLLTKWRLPETTIGAHSYLVVFASGKNRAVAGLPLHTSFNLSASGEYLALVRSDGTTVVSQFAPTFPEQYPDISYGDFGGTNYYFNVPTPGIPNQAAFLAFVEDTRFGFDRGFYTNAIDLVITTATASATIRYTTNGTAPSATNGLVYSAPIHIARTAVIRAAAFKTGYRPSNVDTHTYLFPKDVITQSTNGTAPPGWPATWGRNRVDYGMDPEIVNSPTYSNRMIGALLDLPSVSLVMALPDLFDATNGIYANAAYSGDLWERPASVELLNPDASKGFQVEAGVRIRGNFSTTTNNAKHSFRLFFRSEYGDAKLKYPVYGDAGADTFDGIDLSTFQNHSWSIPGTTGTNGLFLRDHLCRDIQLAMGHQAERGRYCHLYIDGQYWGVYTLSERAEASYAATYFGGSKEDYDVVKTTGASSYTIEATDGTMAAWQRLWEAATNGFASDEAYQRVQGNNPDGSRNPSLEILLDVTNLVDYALIAIYAGSRDGPLVAAGTSPNNWYGIRNTNGTQGFHFFVHDFEHSLLSLSDNRIGPYAAGAPGTGGGLPKSSPWYIWQQLQSNPNFRLFVADRVHKYFFNGGLLTPETCRALFDIRTNQLDHALIAESARWGDAARTQPYTRDVDWINVVNLMVTNYLPQRTSVVLDQLRAKNLYPYVVAPSFSQHGGNVQPGFSVAISAPAGAIYFTVDGTEPRLADGSVSPGAQVYTGPVLINENTLLKARVLSGGVWSALNEAQFTVIQTFTTLAITEIMYHPPADGLIDGDEFEFIELKNVGPSNIDVGGVHFSSGTTFTFPNGTILGPGEFAVLVSNPTEFARKYPGVPISGWYSGRLANGGETLTLLHAVGTLITTLTYGDAAPWPAAADGAGYSIVPVNANFNPNPADPMNWRASAYPGGSPGQDDPSPAISPIVVNEVLTHTDPPQSDSAELFNPGDTAVDIGGWFLTDDRTVPKKFRIPSPTWIAPQGFVTFTESDFNRFPESPTNFTFNSHGEEVYLYSADASGNLTGYSHGFSFGASANGVSFGRYVTSTGESKYPAQISNSFNATNVGPRVGPVVINEIRYKPLPGELEFIELKNITTTTVMLYDPVYPTNRWRLDGVDFDFPAGIELTAGGLLVVCAGDPVTFRTQNSIPAGVQVLGPFPGLLQDQGEPLQLLRPDKPDVMTNGAIFVPMIVVDEVRYKDEAPWPISAPQSGASLERIDAAAFGDDPINWRARLHGATPGYENTRNLEPIVLPGSSTNIAAALFPFTISLEGAVIDDGLPSVAGLSASWTQLSGPATVIFANPQDPGTTATFPKLGTYVLRLSATDGEFQCYSNRMIEVGRAPTEQTYVPRGSVWKYLDNGSNQGTAWVATNFNDSSWAYGPAKLGYGQGDEATVVSYGTNSSAKYPTTYFRRSFVVTNPAVSLNASLLRDDGAVVYLNGNEILRSNMPTNTINYLTWAASVVGSGNETTFFEYPLPTTSLNAGTNVLAVEVHQANATSSDLDFDFELTGMSYGSNCAPFVNAGGSNQCVLPLPLTLWGSVFDDGLPVVPGIPSIQWMVQSGSGGVVFADPTSASTVVSFAQPGTYVLRLSANDGALQAFDTATIQVISESFAMWQARFFTPAELQDALTSGVAADPDHDGHTNYQEFLTGTDPRDSASVLRLEILSRGSNLFALRFPAAAAHAFNVQQRTNLSLGSWTVLSNVTAVATNRLMEIPLAAVTNSVFYRVSTP